MKAFVEEQFINFYFLLLQYIALTNFIYTRYPQQSYVNPSFPFMSKMYDLFGVWYSITLRYLSKLEAHVLSTRLFSLSLLGKWKTLVLTDKVFEGQWFMVSLFSKKTWNSYHLH